MPNSQDPIRITSSDLQSQGVDEYVETLQWLTRDMDDSPDQPWLIRIIYANWFYLSFAAGLGGLCGWAILEPFFSDDPLAEDTVAALLMFPVVAGFIGLFLGAAEGFMCRNPGRAVTSGAVGLVTGFLGGLLALIPTGILFQLIGQVALSLQDGPLDEHSMPSGLALAVFMMGRGAAWAVASIPAGLGQGFAIREKRVMFNGLVGGVLGGLIGGVLFDPISMVLLTDDGEATYSRAVGFATIGLSVGLFVGLVEGWTKTAWLMMEVGPLAGKQFVLFKDTTVLGSSPKADVYLFKDDAIEPTHAIIYNRGGRFEIVDQNTPDGTYINGIPIKSQLLQTGDQVILGKTVLEFSVKDSG